MLKDCTFFYCSDTASASVLFPHCIVKIWIDLCSSFSVYGSTGELLQRFPPSFSLFSLASSIVPLSLSLINDYFYVTVSPVIILYIGPE
jgi:hypothetical protein